jgi:predicted nucleic acid-binding protein
VWDAAAWIALIIDEKIRDASGRVIEDRGAMARGIQAAARRGVIEIVTPALALIETCGSGMVRNGLSNDKVEAYFDHEYIQVAPVDTELAKRSRGIIQQRLHRSLPHCGPCDAVYVATAADWNIAELHTFDKGLLRLSEQFLTRDGQPILICKPDITIGGTGLFAATAQSSK